MIKYFIGALSVILGSIELNAQTALTSDMVWRDGTRWTTYYDALFAYCEWEIKATTVDELGEVLQVCPVNPNGFESLTYKTHYLKLEGSKLYGYTPYLNYTDMTWEWNRCQLYDFDDWHEGNTVQYCFTDISTTESNYEQIDALKLITTDPAGKYNAYAFAGGDNDALRLKGVGRIESDNLLNALFGYRIPEMTTAGSPRQSGSRIYERVLEISNPEYGTLFRHPDYDQYMAMIDIDGISIDMVWRDGTHWRVFSEETREIKEYVLREGRYNDVECLNVSVVNSDGSETEGDEYVRRVGQKVYGVFPYGSEPGKEYASYEMYDFDRWYHGTFIYFSGINQLKPDAATGWYTTFSYDEMVYNPAMMVTDPDSKYCTYSYRNRYSANGVLRLKNIGVIESDDVLNVMVTHIVRDANVDDNRKYVADGKVHHRVLEVSNPEYGILFRHPDYDKYSGISNVPADDTEPEISVDGGVLYIRTAGPTDVHVYTVMGLEVHGGRVDGETSIALPGGIYVVQVGTVTRKVMLVYE